MTIVPSSAGPQPGDEGSGSGSSGPGGASSGEPRVVHAGLVVDEHPLERFGIGVLLFLGENLLGAAVMGVLALVLVAPLAANPAILVSAGDIWLAILGGLGLALKGALSALVIWLATGLIVLAIGIPIRIHPRARRVWLGTGELTVAAVVLGVILLVASYTVFGSWMPSAASGIYSFVPGTGAFLLGWFLLALGLSLFVWPHRWMPAARRAWWIRTQLTP